MVINKDYMAIMRRGKFVLSKATFRKEQEAGFIVGMCIFLCSIILLLATVIK